MQITLFNINSTNKINVYSNVSNPVNFNGNKKPEKKDTEASKPSFLMQMGQKRAKKLELSLPAIQKQADSVAQSVKMLNFPINGDFEGHPDNIYERAITILSNDLMREITDRGTPRWEIECDIATDEMCVGNDGQNNPDERKSFLYEYLSDNETFETHRYYSDSDNSHDMTAIFTKNGIIVEKKSTSGSVEELSFSPEGRLLHYTRKDSSETSSGKAGFSLEYTYDEQTGGEVYFEKGDRHNDSARYIFKDGKLVMSKRYPASAAYVNNASKPAKLAVEFKNGKIKNIFEDYTEENGGKKFSAKYSVNKDGKPECIYNTAVFNPSAKIHIDKKEY